MGTTIPSRASAWGPSTVWPAAARRALAKLTAIVFLHSVSSLSVMADEVRIVAKPGDAVSIPNDPNAYTISRISNATNALSIPEASSSGAVTFQAQIAGPGITTSNAQCVIRSVPVNGGWAHTAVACRNRTAMVSNSATYPNATFTSFSNPKIDDYGCVSFQAAISGTGFSSIGGYWSTCSATLATPILMAQTGMPAPGLATGTLSSITDAVMPRHTSEPALIVTSNVIGAPTSNITRLFGKARPGVLQLLACPNCGGALPGDSSSLFGSLLQLSVGDSGAAALFGNISTPSGSGIAVWRALTGELSSLELIARQGSSAPGMDGWTYTTLDGGVGSRPVITNQGALIHTARVTNSSSQTDYGLWLTPPGSSQPTLLARGQQQAPGLSTGTTLGQLHSPSSQRSTFGGDILPGEPQSPIVFLSNMLGGSATTSNNRALWRLSPGAPNAAPQLIGQGGMQAPDTEPGVTILNSTFGSSMTGNRQGDVALLFSLNIPNYGSSYAYYITRNNALRLAAREGQEIPGSGLKIVTLNIQPQMYINDIGQLLFYALLSPDGSANDAQFGLVGADQDGTLSIVATPGQILRPSNGPDSQLGGLSYSQSDPLRNSGQFVFGAVVTGSSFTEAIFSAPISPPATTPQCQADFNHDGQSTLQDLFDYLNAWFALAPTADLNGSATVTNEDLSSFIGLWLAGC